MCKTATAVQAEHLLAALHGVAVGKELVVLYDALPDRVGGDRRPGVDGLEDPELFGRGVWIALPPPPPPREGKAGAPDREVCSVVRRTGVLKAARRRTQQQQAHPGNHCAWRPWHTSPARFCSDFRVVADVPATTAATFMVVSRSRVTAHGAPSTISSTH